MTIIERVARAICILYGDDWDEKPESGLGLKWGDPGLPSQRDFEDMARAAIEAMREPTDDMIEAGWPHTADPCWPENVGAAYKAMIDVALSD